MAVAAEALTGVHLLPDHIRANGEIDARFTCANGRTSLAGLREGGGLRLRLPRAAGFCEAVILNTGGGIAGGDRQALRFEAGPGAQVEIATQAAEKVYRAQPGQTAEIDVALRLAAGSRLEWLPQETILFNGARLTRRLYVEMAADAALTLVESVVFGRIASGESSIDGAFRDIWRVRRDGRLMFAENFALDGALGDILDRPALGGGARACATLLHAAPDAESRLEPLRAALAAQECEWGASAWDGKLVLRALSPSPALPRAAIMAAMESLRGRDAPRVWRS